MAAVERFKIPDEVKPHADALRRIAPVGISAAPDLESSPLLELDVVRQEAGPAATPQKKAVALTAALVRITTVGQPGALMGKDREAAVRLLGLDDWAGVPSRHRYEAIAKLYDKRWTWENFRKEPLDRLLFTVYLGLHRLGQLHGPAVSVSDGHQRPAFDYRLRDFDITYRMPRGSGQAREDLEVREIEALVDGVASWQAPTRYWGKAADRGPEITLFGPGELTVHADSSIVGTEGDAGRAYVTKVVFPVPLRRGESVRFTLLKRQEVDYAELVRHEWQDCRSVTPVLPIDRLSVRVCFPNADAPSEVWRFSELEDWLVPGVPADDSKLDVDIGNSTAWSWNDLRIGMSYGIGWRW